MLESREQKLVSYIEQYWYERGSTPSVSELALGTGYPEKFVRETLAREDFTSALRNRGLDIIPGAKLLSPEQIALANTLLDFSDDRTAKQKISSLGLTNRAYSAWLKQPAFKNYITARAEQLFGDAMPEAHLSLVNQVKRGDMGAIKLFYEMSGRWSSKTIEETNIEFLMMRLIEIIQKHVSDPVALQAIAEDIGALVPANTRFDAPPPVGALNNNHGKVYLDADTDSPFGPT